tara:strand:+ start:52 stop:747 length:696 start_codon:yes stop_codon:yes gene_type:complete
MRIFSYIFVVTLAVIFSGQVHADIFLKRDNSNSGSGQGDRPIFITPNSKGSATRKAPTYNIMNPSVDTSNKSNNVTYDSQAQRLQAQKLRDARTREYKRRRGDSINLQTLAEDYAQARGGNVKLDQLLDTTAYDAARYARMNDMTAMSQQVHAAEQAEKEEMIQSVAQNGQQAIAENENSAANIAKQIAKDAESVAPSIRTGPNGNPSTTDQSRQFREQRTYNQNPAILLP